MALKYVFDPKEESGYLFRAPEFIARWYCGRNPRYDYSARHDELVSDTISHEVREVEREIHNMREALAEFGHDVRAIWYDDVRPLLTLWVCVRMGLVVALIVTVLAGFAMGWIATYGPTLWIAVPWDWHHNVDMGFWWLTVDTV